MLRELNEHLDGAPPSRWASHVSEGPLNAFIREQGGSSPPVRFSDLFAPHGTIYGFMAFTLDKRT